MSTQPLLDEAKLSEERKKAFMESKFEPKNQKYGLFSYTGTLAISDRPYYTKHESHRDKDGIVKTGPRNFYTSPGKHGNTNDVYFLKSQYYSDKYTEPAKFYLKDKERAEKMKKNHDINWKPGGNKPEPYSLFESMPTEKPKKINRKGPDGKVIIGPRNFMTSPPKQGAPTTTPGVLLGPDFKYIPDSYDRAKQLAHEERIKHHSKMQSSSFKSMDAGGRLFYDFKQTFNTEGIVPSKSSRQTSEPKIVKHNQPFYPMSSGHYDCFEKYPEHVPDVRVPYPKSPLGDKPSWKSTTNLRTIPSPSIVTSSRNLRTEFPILRRN
ncbi:hypothetical protein SteCoe_2680 [Stentor coeruleus]|uniref:Cilia-and flagella-associated protein 96 n=1 Tax=Stentor coeruleus TaxID=5963 RepID=A0A1R2CYV7_9CILI|nr:hypothetical protein SteCoe_2680 [Stentor coeruleus]